MHLRNLIFYDENNNWTGEATLDIILRVGDHFETSNGAVCLVTKVVLNYRNDPFKVQVFLK